MHFSSGGGLVQHGTRWYKYTSEVCTSMEFQTLFPILRNRLSDGYDVPMYCRELFAQITEVTEDEWGTPKDPESKKQKSPRFAHSQSVDSRESLRSLSCIGLRRTILLHVSMNGLWLHASSSLTIL